MWTLDAHYEAVISSVWERYVPGNLMFRVVTKMHELKSAFRKMDHANFSHIEKRVDMMHLALLHCQQELWNDPQNQQLLAAAACCDIELSKLKHAQEEFLKQKSKCDWVQQGDDNTAVFHASMRKRTALNRIISLTDQNGTECKSTASIKAAFREYYQDLLGPDHVV